MKKFILTIVITIISISSASAMSLVQTADSAYNAEDYRLAIRLYHQAINADGFSPELYYNLANAYYRINNLGRAVVYYQRALNLNPSMNDARENLEFVKTRILDKPEDDSSFLGNLHSSVSSMMSPNAWAWLAFGLFATLLGCIALYIFSNNVRVRKTGFFGGFVVFVLEIYVSVIAWQSASAYYHSDMAVVVVPTSNMRTVPGNNNNDDNKVIPIHEGTILEITDSTTIPGATSAPKWYDVKINNSTRAWINAADVERI